MNIINYLEIITSCFSLLVVCSVLFPIVIEAIKKIINDDNIKKIFGSLELFSLVISIILGILIFICYLIFFIFGMYQITFIDIIKFIFIGITFVISCGIGSQVGYDKLLKVLKQIFLKE